nr:PREDICTED: uncharacterized protein LOC105675157 isoform X2 [Linepithema humile]
MGSVESARHLCNDVTDMMYSSNEPKIFDLAEYLDEYLNEKFSTELEDESHFEVADELEKFFRYFENREMVKAEQEFNMLPPVQSWIYTDRHINDPSVSVPAESKSSNTNIEEQDMDEDEESNMDADDDTVDMNLDKNKDTDGWTLVTNKRNK